MSIKRVGWTPPSPWNQSPATPAADGWIRLHAAASAFPFSTVGHVIRLDGLAPAILRGYDIRVRPEGEPRQPPEYAGIDA